MKKQAVVALVLMLFIPVLFRVEGWGYNRINPESAAGHPNYAKNYYFLSQMQHLMFWGMLLTALALWVLTCWLVIRSKGQSSGWLPMAAFGPLGFAVLSNLRDRIPAKWDLHERFVRKLNKFVRVGYFVCVFIAIWMLSEQAMEMKRNWMIRHEAARTGVSVQQIIDQQNASSGMWAFAEGNEVMYFVILLYLIWPLGFNAVGGLVGRGSRQEQASATS